MPNTNQLPFLSSELLLQFGTFLAGHIGLNFEGNRMAELERGIRKAAPIFGHDDPAACIQWLMAGNLSMKQMEILSSFLTVGETYFFRERETFACFEQKILPQISQAGALGTKSLRIWSVACSTGEEAYSIAVVLDRNKGLFPNWDISILATDINPQALEKAQAGIYTPWSFRDCPPWLIDGYFTPCADESGSSRFAVKEFIKKMVSFSFLNLAQDNYPSLINNTNGMDVVFCRNVLMYFLPPVARAVVTRLHKSLVKGGWIVFSPTDSFHVQGTACFQRYPGLSVVFTKCSETADHASLLEPLSFAAHLPFSGLPASEFAVGANGIEEPVLFSPLPQPEEPTQPISVPLPQLETGGVKSYEQLRRQYDQGEYAALRDYFETLETVTDNRCLELAARCCANIGRLEEALHWCDRAIAAEKSTASHYYLRAVILLEAGRIEEAFAELRRCLYLDRDFILAHFTLGNMAVQQGDDGGRHFKNALELLASQPDDQVVFSQEALTAGRLRSIIETTMAMKRGAVE